jgi:hypothetical protein
MDGDGLLKFPFILIDPNVALDFILKSNHRARISCRASSRPGTRVVIKLVSRNYAALRKILILEFELFSRAIECPAVNGMNFLVRLQIDIEIGFAPAFGSQDSNHAAVVLQVLGGTSDRDACVVEQNRGIGFSVVSGQ